MMETRRQQLAHYAAECNRAHKDRLREVAGAATAQDVLAGRITPPALFILRMSFKRDERGHTINVSEQYLFLLAIANVRDARGEDSSDEAQMWSDRIEIWMKDFEPAFPEQPRHRFLDFQLLKGQTQRFTDQVLFWGDIYQLNYCKEKCHS